MREPQILIVEDDPSVRAMLEALLNKSGYRTVAVSDGEEAIKTARRSPFHLFLVDHHLPGMNGIDVLKLLRKIDAEAVIIVMTAYGTIELAVEALKAGAYDYLPKPFQVDLVLTVVEKALNYYRLRHENYLLQKTVHEKYRFENMIGSSPAMQRVFEMIEKVADSDSTVLLQGESGTGKEVIAKTIHFNSPRKNKPFISINCGAIPESLLESELFGHEEGAFTGAVSSRLGRFELAHGGTLFLDEISEMPFPMQVKLLRVLQEREFERVGGTKSIQVDVRIIAATNQDLEAAVAEKKFRKDLFYRLHVIPILAPSLRERKDDIPLLLLHFIDKFNDKTGKQIKEFSPEALKLLMAYPWPGNVRELENLIERIVTLKQEGPILPEDLPEKYKKEESPVHISFFEFPEGGINFTEAVSEFQTHLLRQALSKANGVKNKAARLLRLNRTTLVEKLKRLDKVSLKSIEKKS